MTREEALELLGMKAGATDEAIEAAYRVRARKAHPDREGGDADLMTRLNVAKDTLLDPDKASRLDPFEAQVAQRLMMAVRGALQINVPNDVVGHARNILKQQLDGAAQQLNQATRLIETINRRRGAIRKKTAGRSIFDDMFDKDLRDVDANIENIQAEQKLILAALSLCDDYESTDVMRQAFGSLFLGQMNAANPFLIGTGG